MPSLTYWLSDASAGGCCDKWLGGTMTLTVVLLGAILLVIGCGGIFLYRALVEVRKLLEQINAKLPSSPLLTKLLSI